MRREASYVASVGGVMLCSFVFSTSVFNEPFISVIFSIFPSLLLSLFYCQFIVLPFFAFSLYKIALIR